MITHPEAVSIAQDFMRHCRKLREEILELRRQVMEREEEIRKLKIKMRKK